MRSASAFSASLSSCSRCFFLSAWRFLLASAAFFSASCFAFNSLAAFSSSATRARRSISCSLASFLTAVISSFIAFKLASLIDSPFSTAAAWAVCSPVKWFHNLVAASIGFPGNAINSASLFCSSIFCVFSSTSLAFTASASAFWFKLST